VTPPVVVQNATNQTLASMIEEQLNFILCQHSKSQTKGMHGCIEQGGRKEGFQD